MKKLFLTFSMCLMAFSLSAAELNIYASGLKAGALSAEKKLTIEYVLNAPATALEFLLLKTTDSTLVKTIAIETASDLTKGVHKDVVIDLAGIEGGTYNWALRARATKKTNSEAVITGNQDIYTYYHPRGIEVNKFPETEYFGSVYVAEARTYEKGTERGDQGIYIYSPLLDDPYNQGYGTTGAFDGGIEWEYTDHSTSGPRRLAIAEDGYLYISANNANNSGVWRMDPANPSANFVEILAQSAHGRTFGTVDAIEVKGSGEELVLYTLNNVGVHEGQLYAYAIGNQTAFIGAPTEPFGDISSSLLNSLATIREDGRGGFWLVQNRGAGDSSANYGFRHISSTGVIDLTGDTVLPPYIPGVYQAATSRGAMALNADKSKIAIGANGEALIFSIAFDAETGIPILTQQYRVSIPLSGNNNVDGLAFDYAENIYVISASPEKLYVYNTPGNNVCTTPAPKAYTLNIAGTATTIENIIKPMEVRKVFENGTIYIIRNGEKYAVDGRKL